MVEEGKEAGGEKKEGSGSSSSSDFPPKKQLARQLDFTSSAAGDGSSVPVESRPTQPREEQQARPLAPPATSSPVAQQAHTPLRKPDSPKSRSRPNADLKEGTPKKQKQCNCKHSRCLKLYCECFASGIYCDGCNCVNCCNNVDNEAARREAIETALERNPNAFRPKIASSPHGTRVSREEAGDVPVLVKHNKGCHCKKSGCLKKYCECFQANILCSDNCKCMDCKNFEGSEERQALFHGDQANNITYIQQAANAAITGAIGSSGFAPPPVSKKRKGQENLFGSTVKDPSYHRLAQFQQASHTRASVPSSPFSLHVAPRVGSITTSSPSKCHYRSLLADIIQPQDLKELCSVLVVLSAKVLEDTKKEIEKQANQTQTSLVSHEDRPTSQMETKSSQLVPDDCSTASQGQNNGPDDSKVNSADAPAERPLSPGTLELMCDEQDTIFPGASPPNELFGHGHNRAEQVSCGPGMTEIYEEQERTILTKFRDTLNRLITCGQIKESRCSLARSELGNKSDILSNGTTTARSGSANQQGPIGTGSAKVISSAGKPSQTLGSVVANVTTDCSPAVQPVTQNGETGSIS